MDTSQRLSEMLEAGKRELAEQLRELKVASAESVATAESADGLVTATADARCRLVDLSLDQRIFRRPDSVALARTILGTVHAAAGEAGQQVTARLGWGGGEHGRV